MIRLMTNISFRRIDRVTVEDNGFLHKLDQDYIRGLPTRIFLNLEGHKNSSPSYQVNRHERFTQTASRAERDGANIALISAALIHDIVDELAPEKHSEVAAEIIRFYISTKVTSILEKHYLFQMCYYAAKLGFKKIAEIPIATINFPLRLRNSIKKLGQMSFGPEQLTNELSHFEPIVREIFMRPPFDLAIILEHR